MSLSVSILISKSPSWLLSAHHEIEPYFVSNSGEKVNDPVPKAAVEKSLRFGN